MIDGKNKRGNVFTVPSNEFAEFNMFLDPVAAKKVMESNLRITLIPLSAQQKVSSFKRTLQNLKIAEKTPESIFAHSLLSLLDKLQQKQPKLYNHMVVYQHFFAACILLCAYCLFFFLWCCRKYFWGKSLVQFSWLNILN